MNSLVVVSFSYVTPAIMIIMKEIWKATIEGKPVSTNTAYKRSKNGRMFMTKQGKDYKALVADTAQYTYSNEEPAKGNIQLHIDYTFADKRRRDVNNYDKIIVDALEGIVFENDVQVDTLLLHKVFGDNFLTEIKVYER